jgi:hypothetical protein
MLAERKHLVVLVWWARRLPWPTIALAVPARRIGSFGLVASVFTILYHVSILGPGLPCEAFTNLYHRDGGLTIEPDL